MSKFTFELFTYSHSGYCSGDDNAIEKTTTRQDLKFDSIESLSSRICQDNSYIYELFDMIDSYYSTHIDIKSIIRQSIQDLLTIDTPIKDIIIIKCYTPDIGSGYCGDKANHNDFINDNNYNEIIKMKVCDVLLIIHQSGDDYNSDSNGDDYNSDSNGDDYNSDSNGDDYNTI
jgi:hypothetical protein